MEKQFTEKEFIGIYHKLEYQTFEEILGLPEYKDFYIYHINSKIPMSGDDWTYHGSYMTRSRAEAEYDAAINAHGYGEGSRPPISVDIDGIPLNNVSSHFDALASDYSLLMKEVFEEILTHGGLNKFNKTFNTRFLSLNQVYSKLDTLLKDQIKKQEDAENERLFNDPNIMKAIDLKDIIWRLADSSDYIEYGWIYYSGLYVSLKGAPKQVFVTIKEKKMVDGEFVNYEYSDALEIKFIKPEKPFETKTSYDSKEFSTNTWLEKYDKDGRLHEKLYYGGTDFIDDHTKFKNGYKDIFTDTGFVAERIIYGRLGDPWSTCEGTMDVPPDRKIVLTYELDKTGNPKVIYMKEMKPIDFLIRSSVITIEIGFE